MNSRNERAENRTENHGSAIFRTNFAGPRFSDQFSPDEREVHLLRICFESLVFCARRPTFHFIHFLPHSSRFPSNASAEKMSVTFDTLIEQVGLIDFRKKRGVGSKAASEAPQPKKSQRTSRAKTPATPKGKKANPKANASRGRAAVVEHAPPTAYAPSAPGYSPAPSQPLEPVILPTGQYLPGFPPYHAAFPMQQHPAGAYYPAYHPGFGGYFPGPPSNQSPVAEMGRVTASVLMNHRPTTTKVAPVASEQLASVIAPPSAPAPSPPFAVKANQPYELMYCLDPAALPGLEECVAKAPRTRKLFPAKGPLAGLRASFASADLATFADRASTDKFAKDVLDIRNAANEKKQIISCGNLLAPEYGRVIAAGLGLDASGVKSESNWSDLFAQSAEAQQLWEYFFDGLKQIENLYRSVGVRMDDGVCRTFAEILQASVKYRQQKEEHATTGAASGTVTVHQNQGSVAAVGETFALPPSGDLKASMHKMVASSQEENLARERVSIMFGEMQNKLAETVKGFGEFQQLYQVQSDAAFKRLHAQTDLLATVLFSMGEGGRLQQASLAPPPQFPALAAPPAAQETKKDLRARISAGTVAVRNYEDAAALWKRARLEESDLSLLPELGYTKEQIPAEWFDTASLDGFDIPPQFEALFEEPERDLDAPLLKRLLEQVPKQ
jgi:hypothetical protein